MTGLKQNYNLNLKLYLRRIFTEVGQEEADPLLRGDGISTGREISLQKFYDAKEGLLMEAEHLPELCVAVDIQDLRPFPHDAGLPNGPRNQGWEEVSRARWCPPQVAFSPLFSLLSFFFLLSFVVRHVSLIIHGFETWQKCTSYLSFARAIFFSSLVVVVE